MVSLFWGMNVYKYLFKFLYERSSNFHLKQNVFILKKDNLFYPATCTWRPDQNYISIYHMSIYTTLIYVYNSQTICRSMYIPSSLYPETSTGSKGLIKWLKGTSYWCSLRDGLCSIGLLCPMLAAVTLPPLCLSPPLLDDGAVWLECDSLGEACLCCCCGVAVTACLRSWGEFVTAGIRSVERAPVSASWPEERMSTWTWEPQGSCLMFVLFLSTYGEFAAEVGKSSFKICLSSALKINQKFKTWRW